MKNLLNNLLNWVLKKGSSETKKDQAWEEKEQAGSKKEQVKGSKLSEKEQAGSKKEQAEQKGNKLSKKGTSLEKRTKLEMGSEAMSANHALITQLSRTNHPISLRAIRYAAVIFMVLMVGIGNVWASQELKGVYMKYLFNGNESNYEYYNSDNNNNPVLDLGTLTSGTFKITEVYWKTKDNWKTHKINAYGWYNMGSDTKFAEYDNYTGSNTDDCDCEHEIQNTNVDYTVATANTGNSGLFTFSHWWIANFHWSAADGDKNVTYCTNNSKNYNFTYRILPPNATAITATPTGAISGSGTELDPYIVPYGGNLTIALSGSDKARADANSSVQYSVDGGSTWGTSSKTFSNVTATSTQNWVFKARCYNSTASLASPSETTKTVYYKASYGVSVYKFVTKSSGLGTTNVGANSLTTSNSLSTLIGGTLTGVGNSNNLCYNNNSIRFTGGASAYLQIGLENKIKAGDVIRYRYVSTSNASSAISIQTTKGTTSNQITLSTASGGHSKIQTVTITAAQATAFSSLSTIYLVRTGSNNMDLDYFEILRPYKVTLDANTNGGTVNGENTENHYHASGETFVLPHATKNGYRFKGWFTTSGGSSQAANPYTPTATTTLYARFEDCPTGNATVYKFQVGTGLTDGSVTANNVNFDFNVGNDLSLLYGGTLSTGGSKASNVKIANNNSISIEDNGAYLKVDLDCALQTGDKFITTVASKPICVSSTTSQNTSNSIAAGELVETTIPAAFNGLKTFYIHRNGSSPTLTYFEIYRPEACTEITPTFSTAYTSTTLTLGGGNSSTPAINKDGSAGAITWTSSNTGVATVNSSGVVTPKKVGTATITATVAAAEGKCEGSVSADFTIKGTITYNANTGSGSVPTDASTYAKDAKITVAGKNTLTKADCAFAGWNTKDNGSGDWYIPGEKITMGESNITLYAQWATCISTSDFSGRKAAGYDDASETSSDLKTTFSILNKLGGSTTYDNSSGYTGLKLRNSGDWIGFAVAAGSSVTVTTQTVNTSPTVTIDFSSATTLSANTDNVYAADNSNIRFFRIKAADGAAVVINKITIGASCSTDPTVEEGGYSDVTTTTATVSCASGISSLGSAGCSITSYGFVIGTSANPAIGGSGVTQHQVGTSYASTGTSFSKNLTGLTAGTTYYVRPYATNGNGTAYGDQTSFTTLPTTPTFSPASGSTVNGSQTITITGHSGSTVYYVWATSAQSASDIYNSGSGSHGTEDAGTASVPVQSGKTLYAISRISDTNSAVGSASYTVDATAPSVSSATPASSATDVSISGNVTFTFGENVTIVDASKFAISPSAGVTWSTGSATVDGATVTIPYSGLSYSTVYTISAAAGAVKDAVNNTSTAWAGHSFTTEAEPVLYTVTYTYNGATGGNSTESSTQASSGASVTLPTPTKTNYTFQGWYESGGTKAGDGGDSYTPTADITVYALWRADCAGGGGGGGTLFSQNFSGSGSLTYTQEVGYTKKSGLTGIVGNAANLFTSITTSNKNTTGIAINHATGGNSVNATGIFQAYFNNTSGYWSVIRTNDFAATAPTAVKMSMDFYLDQLGSSSSAVMVNFAIGDGFSESLKSSSAESTSNIHSGWGITVESSMKMCAYDTYGTKIYNTALSDKTWYSVTWVINNTGSDLTYDDPDGSGTTTLANDKFDIWLKTQAQAASNYTKVVSARDANTASKALQELYIGHASGKKHEFRMDNIVVTDLTPSGGDCYYVTYNGNGATGGYTKDETAYALNANPTVASNSFTKTGYTFTGWNTAPGGGGTAYAAGGTISNISADVTLYAQWAADAATYELTWNTNGGSDLVCSGTCTSGELAYGATIVAPTDPTKSNYTFDGWNTANDGSGSAAAATMPASDVTYYAAWKQTVTLKTGLQGSDGDKTPYIYWNGTALSDDAVHSAAGYTLNGYYTASTGGTKVLNADGTFAASAVTDYITSSKWSRTGAAPTLYAQWRAAAGKTCYTWDASETHPQTGTTNYDGLYLTATTKAKKQANSALTDTIYDVSSNGKSLTGHINGAVIDSLIFGASTSSSDNTTFVVSFCSTQTFDTAKIIKVGGYHCTVYNVALNTAAASLTKIKAPAGTKSFVLSRNYMSDKLTSSASLSNSGSRYLYYVRACSASGGTHTISYNAGGGTGTMSSNTGITDDGSQILTTNSFTAPTNYSFAGWVADGAVTIGGDVKTAGTLIADGATITNITMDIALTAKWSQTVTLDDNNENHGATGDGSATAYYNAAALSSITHTTAASGYKLAGYYTAKTDGTKVLNADGTYAGTAVTGWISDSKWTQDATSTPTLYAQYEAAGALIWNLGVNTDATSLTTSSKSSSFTEIAVANMGDATLSGSTYTKSAKSSLTGKISSPATKSDYVYVTFKVADGYKFTPSNISVKVQPVGDGEHKNVELVLTDESFHSLASASATKCDGTTSGKTTTVSLAGNSTFFTGNVTLKIYVYDFSGSATGTYRLGTPITIEGEIEEACGTMPSYTSMSYTTTTFAPNTDASGSPITIVGGDNIDTYQWKYNTVNDRTSGTNCGTGTSLTPLTDAGAATDVTRYYWCEMTNETCDITIKSPAVAITVAAAKNDASVTWTDPATPNYGGGGYTIKATVNQTDWDGNAADLVITAPAGIRIYNVTSGTTSSQKWVQVNFDVQTSFDRSTYASNIPFTVSADATSDYNAISNDHNVSYSACTGGGGDATEYLMPVNADSVNSTVKGWRFAGTGKMWFGHGSSSPSTGSSNIKSLSNTMAEGNIDHYYNTGGSYFSFYTEKAITGVRLYVYTSNSNVEVSNVYIANSQFATGTPSSGAVTYEVVYNDDNEGLDKGDNVYSAWAEITFASEVAAGKYGLIKLDNNVKIAGIGLLSGSSSGADLTTTLSFATAGPIAKQQSSANFTNAATIGGYPETLGAITYTSSNTSCATVNATTGEVTITASGSADLSTTITATLAASGCYRGATASYVINVAGVTCEVNHGTLSSDVTSKCSTADATLTLTGFESGASIQWYNGETPISNVSPYAITTVGTTSTLVTQEEGTYSVMVSVTTPTSCSDRSNSITISNKSTSVHVTRLVKEWYIKNGRLTPDIALWELGDDCSFVSVTASDGWDAGTGLTGEGIFYEQDGVVYMKGTEPKTNDGAVQDYTLTLTVNNGCSNQTLDAEGKKITIHHQQNTDKHVLAFVVRGKDKGGFTDSIPADQTTSVGLYNAIAANFDVLATNSRSTDDEQKLKEYYSQFDILCITDYPDTKKDKGVNGKSTVDALGALVDIRPILTMEAWVSGLANWKAKGISGSPKSPTTRQYTMDLQCKDHEIFAGTKLTKVGEGDEAMYRVSMVDNTKEDYATLDATYGDGAHAEKEGYQYGKKPALQGFTFTQEMSDNDLLPIGLIDDGAGNPLQVGIERQHNMEARLMVLGINSYAMERLTDDGERVVINALNYLMKKNAEDIADCSTSFVGGADGDEKNWNNADNWTGNTVPLPTQKVRILADCEVSSTVHALDVLIVTGGKYNHGSDDAAGKLTIKENGALIVGGKIQAASAPAYNRPRATTPDKLIINTNEYNQAALIFDNEEAETQATVKLYSLGRKPSSYQYQYFAVPMEVVPVNPTFANETHGGTGIYTYVYEEATSGWTRRKYYDDLFAFEGLGITTKSPGAMNYTMTGNLASTATKEITLTHAGAGLNLIGNSWMAPIQIGALAEDNTGLDNQTVYIYCAGRDADGGALSDVTETPGQWIAIPFEAAEFETWKAAGKLSVIPAMQAFQIKVSAEATLTLDYDKVVRGSTNDLNAKLRAPGRRMAANEVTMTNIRVADSKTHTDLSLFEGDRFSEAFDNGWEAEYMNGDGRSAKLYAETEAGQMAVVAMYDYEGTVVGFAPGQETEYTFSFMGEDNGYYLNDIKLQNSVRISEGETYTFTYEEGDAANRFYISRTAINAPEVATGMENLDAAVPRVQKIIYNDKLYIIRGGRLYDATGKVVK